MGKLDEDTVKDRQLERQGRRLGHSGWWFLLVGLVVAIPGIILIVINTALGLGIAIVFIASIPAGVGVALLASSLVSRWSARRKSFA
jgi:hypothetical protein